MTTIDVDVTRFKAQELLVQAVKREKVVPQKSNVFFQSTKDDEVWVHSSKAEVGRGGHKTGWLWGKVQSRTDEGLWLHVPDLSVKAEFWPVTNPSASCFH